LQHIVISCIGAARVKCRRARLNDRPIRGCTLLRREATFAEIEKLAKTGAVIDGRDGNGHSHVGTLKARWSMPAPTSISTTGRAPRH